MSVDRHAQSPSTRLLRMSALKMTIVVSVAAIELAVIAQQPKSAEIAAFSFTATLLAWQLLSVSHRMNTERPRRVGTLQARALRRPRVRITVRGMMIVVVLLAILLWPVHHWYQRPYYEERAAFHG